MKTALDIILILSYTLLTVGYVGRLYFKDKESVKTKDWVHLIGLTGGWVIILFVYTSVIPKHEPTENYEIVWDTDLIIRTSFVAVLIVGLIIIFLLPSKKAM